MSKDHTLLLVIGRTACGKDRLVNKLCEQTNLTAITSYTTRERRVNEGATHVFVTEEDYQQMKDNEQIAAFTQIGKNKYWSTIEQLYINDLYIIDYEGIKTLRQLNLPNLRLVTVFVNVPDAIREDRALNKRKDDRMKFRQRNIDEREQFREMTRSLDFDYMIPNIDFAKAYSCLKHISNIEGVWKNHEEDKA